jgi:hypothetical protein
MKRSIGFRTKVNGNLRKGRIFSWTDQNELLDLGY